MAPVNHMPTDMFLTWLKPYYDAKMSALEKYILNNIGSKSEYNFTKERFRSINANLVQTIFFNNINDLEEPYFKEKNAFCFEFPSEEGEEGDKLRNEFSIGYSIFDPNTLRMKPAIMLKYETDSDLHIIIPTILGVLFYELEF
jgi:hypothetical protein